ncbi:hypothetical protein [Archangium primigenium]|uniref:hypothetical protein n=1 Tax=[Archangium] primigenium TaxID=2792470 RepID=UPI001958E65A|nr:hypothetical protein [Archangium primigenium]MBM7116881.1 hypothetical protein [Archangium primigenium]
MRRSLRLLSSTLLAGLFLTASQAEARFGKRSAPESSSSEDRSERDTDKGRDSDAHDASAVDDSTHDATPVDRSPPSRRPAPSRRPDRSEPSQRPAPRPAPSRGYYTEPYTEPSYDDTEEEVYYPAPARPLAPLPDGPAYGSEAYRSRRSKNFQVGYEGQLLPGGRASGFHLGVEGESVGAMLRLSALALRPDDGSLGEDRISVVGLHMTWAAFQGRSGRVRLEGGLSIARAPDVTFVGPSLGLSSEYYLLDSLALEGRVHVTPVPYRQLDAAAGAVWYVLGNVIALRGGVRTLVLDDAGAVDGVVHRDVLPGPYVSIGLAL